MTTVASQASLLSLESLQFVRGVATLDFSDYADVLERTGDEYPAQFAEAQEAGALRLDQLGCGRTEESRGMVALGVAGALTAELADGLDADAVADLRRPWSQLLER